MIVGRENIEKWLRMHALLYWKVTNAAGTQIFAESPEEASLTLENSVSFLNQNLDMFMPGNYLIEAWQKENQKKSRYKMVFQISGEKTASGIGSVSPLPMQPSFNLQEEIQKALDSERNRNKIETLEKEKAALEAKVRELEAEINSTGHRVMNRLEPHLGSIMQGLGLTVANSSPAALAGPVKEETVDDNQKRLETAYELWGKHEADPVTITEKIANMAATDSGTYAMARNILMSK
jgi:hypothetical protein